jgi:hypothetical protein
VAVSEKLRDTIAEANAEVVEPEPESETPEPEPEPTPDPEPETPEPATDMAMEEIGRKLDAEAERHHKAVVRIMGEQMETLAPSPIDVTPGYVLAIPPDDFDPEQREAVLRYVSGGMKQYPDFATCETCNGFGYVLSGAQNEANFAPSCPDCSTKGYYSKKERAAQAQAQLDATPSYVPPAPVALAAPPNGSPAGLAGNPLNPPVYDYVTGEWRLP